MMTKSRTITERVAGYLASRTGSSVSVDEVAAGTDLTATQVRNAVKHMQRTGHPTGSMIVPNGNNGWFIGSAKRMRNSSTRNRLRARLLQFLESNANRPVTTAEIAQELDLEYRNADKAMNNLIYEVSKGHENVAGVSIRNMDYGRQCPNGERRWVFYRAAQPEPSPVVEEPTATTETNENLAMIEFIGQTTEGNYIVKDVDTGAVYRMSPVS